MGKLTDKQQAYARNRAAGVGKADSAIAAGYAPVSASVTASKLEARADIKAAIKAARKNLGKDEVNIAAETGLDRDKNTMPRAKYDDPIVFLEDVMNHKHLPVAMRADAAKQLLPYKHARIGEKGKKEKAKERAGEIAKGRGKFGTKEPPKLKVVGGKG